MGYIVFTKNTNINIKDFGLEIGSMVRVICVGGGGGGQAGWTNLGGPNYAGYGGDAGRPGRAGWTNRYSQTGGAGGAGYGAGGGGGGHSGNANYGGKGADGKKGQVLIRDVVLTSEIVNIVVGNGGAGGTGSLNATGKTGGNSKFGEYLIAKGGAGGGLASTYTANEDDLKSIGIHGIDLRPEVQGLIPAVSMSVNVININDSAVGKQGIGHGVVVMMW